MLRTGGDQARERLFGDVVVVEVEGSRRQVVAARECVEFVEAAVADEMRPVTSVRGPDGVIDQYGHSAIIRPGDSPSVRFARVRSIR